MPRRTSTSSSISRTESAIYHDPATGPASGEDAFFDSRLPSQVSTDCQKREQWPDPNHNCQQQLQTEQQLQTTEALRHGGTTLSCFLCASVPPWFAVAVAVAVVLSRDAALHAGATTRIAPGTTVAVNGVSPSSSPSNCTGSGAVLATVISRPRA